MKDLLVLKIRRIYLILFILLSTVSCDQASKLVARDALSVSGPIGYLNSSLRLVHAENPGAFLSFGAKLSDKMRFFIFTFMVLVFLIGLGVYLVRGNLNFLNTTALTLILSGGIGNLIDRAMRGTVTDFIILDYSFFKTGIFNIADVAIVLGVLILFVLNYREASSEGYASMS